MTSAYKTLAGLLLLPLFAFSGNGKTLTGNENTTGANGEEDSEAKRDTASAVVLYDAGAKFMPTAAYDVEFYTNMIDSLVRVDPIPVYLVNQLNVYRNLTKRNRSELFHVVDSIFQAPMVPQPVLNAVNIYLTALERELAAPVGFYAHVPEDKSPYPANAFYNDWNTSVAHPERNNLAAFDSVLTLRLVDHDQNCGFEVPYHGILTSHFGWRWGRNHNGTDINLDVWDPVKAAFPGVVRVARFYKGYGRVVVIRHHNGLETLYAHLHRFKVKSGDEVEAGDVVGLGGSSGNSTASHLHFEMRFQGVPINPATVINFGKGILKQEVIHLRRDGSVLAVVPDRESPSEIVYEVQKGDYLYKIAREQGVTIEDIRTANNLKRNQALSVGQKLRLGT